MSVTVNVMIGAPVNQSEAIDPPVRDFSSYIPNELSWPPKTGQVAKRESRP